MLGNPAIALLFSMIFICVWTITDQSCNYLVFVAASFFVYAIGAASQILMIPRDSGMNAVMTGALYIASAGLMMRGMASRYSMRVNNVALLMCSIGILAGIAYYFYITPNLVVRIYILNLGSAAILLFPVAQWWRCLPKRAIDRLLFWIYVGFAISFFPRTVLSITSAVTGGLAAFAQSPFWITLQLTLLLFAIVLALAILAAAVLDIIERLQNERNIDSLTQLHNRRSFEEQASAMIADKRRRAISLVLCDIDYFKSINDVDGHAAGDQVLQKFGEIIRDYIRAGDIAARVGGEEFALLLPNTTMEGGVELAERLRRHLETTRFRTTFGSRTVTASFGVSQRHEHESLRELFARTDAMLYAAKSNGRNNVAITGHHIDSDVVLTSQTGHAV